MDGNSQSQLQPKQLPPLLSNDQRSQPPAPMADDSPAPSAVSMQSPSKLKALKEAEAYLDGILAALLQARIVEADCQRTYRSRLPAPPTSCLAAQFGLTNALHNDADDEEQAANYDWEWDRDQRLWLQSHRAIARSDEEDLMADMHRVLSQEIEEEEEKMGEATKTKTDNASSDPKA